MSRIDNISVATQNEPFYASIAQLRTTARQFATHCVANLSEKYSNPIEFDGIKK